MVETNARIAPHQVDQLRRSCSEVITPDDEPYDEARRLWNAIHDRRPSVIARPSTADEVATAVRFAREHDLEIVIRSGGHSVAPLTGREGCLVIDLSSMRGVEADPRTRMARANGGALLGELDIAAQEHGLVCPVGVVGHTGVAGLTLGGGVGRLQRNFGLTIDNLAAVELVTADGRLVRATENDEPELFWGLRGAGWNFGIATAFAFHVSLVLGAGANGAFTVLHAFSGGADGAYPSGALMQARTDRIAKRSTTTPMTIPVIAPATRPGIEVVRKWPITAPKIPSQNAMAVNTARGLLKMIMLNIIITIPWIRITHQVRNRDDNIISIMFEMYKFISL
jgi:FAD/FMN-containing dehydrogenase